MTELEDALGSLTKTSNFAEEIEDYWWPDNNTVNDGLAALGYSAAKGLHARFPDSTAAQLLGLSRACGVEPFAEELEGWEQFWIELGLDNTSEVEQTAQQEQDDGWTQPPLPGLEEV